MSPEKPEVTKGATLVKSNIKLTKFEIVKYQIIHHCFLKRIDLNHTELNILALLGEIGTIRLTKFSQIGVKKGVLGSPIAVTNYISRMEQMGFVIKQGVGKKLIYLNPALKIYTEGSIVISLNLIHKADETKKAPATLRENRRTPELAEAIH